MSDKPNSMDDGFNQMTLLLMKDVEHCWEQLHEATEREEQNFWKRAFTRSVFAQIEGFTEYFRSQALIAECNKIYSTLSSGNQISINPGRLSVLAGESFFITDEGDMKRQFMRTPFLPNLLFCFNSFAEARGSAVRIQKGDQWNRIKSAVRVRDGLMHPKKPESLEINQSELEDVAFTWKWFYKALHSIIKNECKVDEFADFPEDLFSPKIKTP